MQEEVDDEYEEDPEIVDEHDSDISEDVSSVSIPFHDIFLVGHKKFFTTWLPFYGQDSEPEEEAENEADERFSLL